MKLLLSNDDGVQAKGLNTLANALIEQGYEIQVVAPDRDRSGASNSLTLDRPLHVTTLDNGAMSIDGTPTDCVHLGMYTLCKPTPYRVISGINAGANLGDDVLYSGTVAAAMEGRFLDAFPIAISLAGKVHFDTAAQVLISLLTKIDALELPPRTLLNVNVPDCPMDQLKGWKVTRLGHRHRSDHPVKTTNPRGKESFWISVAGHGADAGEGTDFHAIEHGYVSITPIQMDMTAHAVMEHVVETLL